MKEKEIGRNDPCPCGSGKKYKVCHMQQKKAAGGYAQGLRKFTAKIISSGPKKESAEQEPGKASKAFLDYNKLMETSYGEAIHDASEAPELPKHGIDFSPEEEN